MSEDQRCIEEQWQDESLAAVHQFAAKLKALHQTNPWANHPLLPSALNHLITELWDLGFTQTDIRTAFQGAINDLPRYAGRENP